MCTAISFRMGDHYFGRTLDLDKGFGEQVVITPRCFPFLFRKMGRMDKHFAIIGMATVVENYPLYYEGTNEAGLSAAGLNFPGNACYFPFCEGKDNVTPYELIPWLLGQCETVCQAESLLRKVNLLDEPFRADFPLTPLHWLLSDRERSVVIESTKDGLFIYDNPLGVMTNNPPFTEQIYTLSRYANLNCENPQNDFLETFGIQPYSNGFGAIGLPGDWSSSSRFARAVFAKEHSVCGESEAERISQFFHVMGSVQVSRGAVRMDNGNFDMSLYTSCCNTDKGIYYYKTYENQSISAVRLFAENLDREKLKTFPLQNELSITYQN